jgi:hypothetical protein
MPSSTLAHLAIRLITLLVATRAHVCMRSRQSL